MFVGVLVSIFSVILAYKAFKASTEAQKASTATQRELKESDLNNQRDLKAMDLRQYFQKRYDDLVDEAKVKARTASAGKLYYRRFWRLQLEEYQYWCDGMIDQRLYETWADSRRFEWNNDKGVAGYSYQKGWNDMKDYLHQHDHGPHPHYGAFIKLMEDIFQNQETEISTKTRCG